MPDEAIQQARSNAFNDISVPLSAQQRHEAEGHYGNQLRSLLGAADLGTARDAAFKQAELDYLRQTGQANSGLGWGNVGARFDELGNAQELGELSGLERRRQIPMQLLQSLGFG